ncbi:MAG: winged helix-turn-helix transcriptional regulator [Alphaproteobacteria bacterium]|jgi:DNA-binding MarR family transcriptional regulator|nr:winged helix-turn-helix transcriptional regulator [Alphaproteobacteria bacterium]
MVTGPNSAIEDGDAEQRITMEMLHAVAEGGPQTQRGLAAKLNIALGLANAYLKRCSRTGLVKISKVPPNRYAYYLTPKGFAEKSRLTANYLYRSFNFYRRARNECDDLIGQAVDRGWRRIALLGTGELAEVALLCALQFEAEIVGVADRKGRANRFRHVPLVRDLGSLEPYDAILLTDMAAPQRTYEEVARGRRAERILVPPLLIVRRAADDGDTVAG